MIRRKTPPGFATALGVVAALLVTSGARAEIIPTLHPDPVTEADHLRIGLRVPFAHLDSCYFTTHQFARVGNQITIDLTTDQEEGICAQVVTDAEVEVPVGPLAAGTYAVTVNHTTLTGAARPQTLNFDILVLPAPPKPRLTGAGGLSFDTVPGRSYRVLCSSTLGDWTPLGGPITGDGTPTSVPLPGGTAKFFRVEVTVTGE